MPLTITEIEARLLRLENHLRTLIDLMDDYSYIGQDAAPELIRIKEEIIRVANPTPIDPTPVDPPPPREPESEIKPA